MEHISFDLIDEPWVPCLMEDGQPRDLGLRALLAEAPEIREIVDPSPPVTVALHRLALAILHRCFGPGSAADWAALWTRGRWDEAVLAAYFARWRDRFNLFDHDHPFYQVTSLDIGYATPVTKLTHELTSPGNNQTLFDHTTEWNLPPAAVARYLLAHQAFTVGGLVSLERGQEPKLFKSADAAPLTKGAVAIVQGGNLFETLMLNLHRYHREDAMPFAFAGEDRPAWEREEETRAEDRRPDGYLDLLTWQSRRVRLFPERDELGAVVVRRVVIMKGNQFPDSWSIRDGETMIAFRKNAEAARGQEPWVAVGFRENRAVWRDSLALFRSLSDGRQRPRTATWLAELVDEGALDRAQTLPLDLGGLLTDRANVVLWRHERLPMPLAYLANPALLDALTRALRLAEAVLQVLRQGVRSLARLLLAPTSDDPDARQPPVSVVQARIDNFGAERRYWSRLEIPFKSLLVDLAADEAIVEGEPVYGGETLPRWAEEVGRTAWLAFAEAAFGGGTSARALKAAADAERVFASRLKAELDAERTQPEENAV